MNHMREATVYLVARPGKWSAELHVRSTTRPPALQAGEVAMAVTVRVPDAMFKRPALKATIEIPADSVSAPVIDAQVVDNIRVELARTLGVDLRVEVVEPTSKDPEEAA
jgi:hypothetical protein